MQLQVQEELVEREHRVHVLLDVEQVDSLVEDHLEILLLAELGPELVVACDAGEREERLAVALELAQTLCLEVVAENFPSGVQVPRLIEVRVRVSGRVGSLLLPRSCAPATACLVSYHIGVASGCLRDCVETLSVLLELVATQGEQEPLSLLPRRDYARPSHRCLLLLAQQLI